MDSDSLLEQTAKDLNDFTEGNPGKSFVRWSRSQLSFYWNEAISFLKQLDASAFSNTITIKLQPGAEQDLKDQCKHITAVIGEAYSDGTLKKELLKDVTNGAIRWFKKPCAPTPLGVDDFELTSYRFTKEGRKLFVKPPVPAGKDVYLKVQCQGTDSIEAGGEVPDGLTDENLAIGMQWVLFRAMSVDENSATSINTAAQHFQAFTNLVQTTKEAEALKNLDLNGLPEIVQKYVGRQLAIKLADQIGISN